MIKKCLVKLQSILDRIQFFDFLAPLVLRLYLVPIFWIAGTQKLQHIDNTIAWFGNAEWGLGLPFPTFLAYAASLTEVFGAIFLLVGFATRWISLPLMVVMIVAALTVHWEQGWLAIAADHHESSLRLQGFLEWLKMEFPGRYDYITELGSPVVLNNGIEFAATYFIMLLSLFFIGAGKYLSLDYWIRRKFMKDKK